MSQTERSYIFKLTLTFNNEEIKILHTYNFLFLFPSNECAKEGCRYVQPTRISSRDHLWGNLNG